MRGYRPITWPRPAKQASPPRKLPTMDGGIVAFILVALIVAVIAILKVRRAHQRRSGDMPQTRFGVPISARICFMLTVGLPLAASMEVEE